MKLTSPVFEQGGQVPSQHTCDGANTSPPLEISEVPARTVSMALIVDDLDAEDGNGITTFVHWVVWDIHPKTATIKAGHVPKNAIEGRTSTDVHHYVGPCPPKGKHRYRFRIFALSKALACSPECDMKEVEEEMVGHIVEEAELIGTYQRI